MPVLAARAFSAKVDGVRLAVASLLSSNVPACVEGATALLREMWPARAPPSRLCLAARVERDAAVAFTASFQHTAPSPEEQRAGGAATRTRRVGREDNQPQDVRSSAVLTPVRLGVSQVLSAEQKWC